MKVAKLKYLYLYFFGVILGLAPVSNALAQGASLSVSPQTGTFTQESTFDVSVYVNTAGNSINAVKIELQFDPQKLQLITPSKGLSLVSEWSYPPSFSNTNGTISLQGGFPSSGINTSQGLITAMTFRAISTGSAFVNFSPASMVLLNDAKGTNILTSFNRGLFEIVPAPPAGPLIFSETHPDQNIWYKNANPSFSWQTPGGANVAFSYETSQDPYGQPDNTPDTALTSVSFENMPEGINYFHLKAQRNGVWGGASHFKFMIDKTPPADFKAYLEPFSLKTGDSLLIYFNTSDLLSGIDYYQVKITDATNPKNIVFSGWTNTESPFDFPAKNRGNFTLSIRAFDKAGNLQESKISARIFAPALILIAGGAIVSGLFLPDWTVYSLFAIFSLSFGYLIYVGLFWAKRRFAGEYINLSKEIHEAEKEIEDVKKTEEKLRAMRLKQETATLEYGRLKEALDNEIKNKNSQKNGNE